MIDDNIIVCVIVYTFLCTLAGYITRYLGI